MRQIFAVIALALFLNAIDARANSRLNYRCNRSISQTVYIQLNSGSVPVVAGDVIHFTYRGRSVVGALRGTSNGGRDVDFLGRSYPVRGIDSRVTIIQPGDLVQFHTPNGNLTSVFLGTSGGGANIELKNYSLRADLINTPVTVFPYGSPIKLLTTANEEITGTYSGTSGGDRFVEITGKASIPLEKIKSISPR